jgi:hypothetical protein
VLGVAFVETPERINEQVPKNGQFLAVGVIIGNHSGQDFTLDNGAFGLTDGRHGGAHRPMLSAYGTLDELKAGQYHQRIVLPPGEAIAAVVVFDITRDDITPRLLVRDLTRPSKQFTGAVDLTKDASPPESGGEAPNGVRPL